MEYLVARRGQCTDESATIAARALDTDHRLIGAVPAEPVQQLPIAVGTVGDDQRRDLTAAVIDQRGGVGVLVDVDADEHQGGLLARG